MFMDLEKLAFEYIEEHEEEMIDKIKKYIKENNSVEVDEYED